jgi:DNA-binding NarL/FixJ family response regulator
VTAPDPGTDQSPGPGPQHSDPGSSDAGSLAELLGRAQLQPPAGELPALETGFLSALVADTERPVARVAALSQVAQSAMRLGRPTECLAVVAELRAAAGDDPAALVWALTSSAACRAIFAQLSAARADVAEARQLCNFAAPLLAEPFWRFVEIVCGWLGGDWTATAELATSLDENRGGPFPHGVAGTVVALRMELLRGLGLPRDCRPLVERLAVEPPAEMSAWALAGLDVDDGRPGDALRRLADVCDVGTRGVFRTAMPLVLYRMAEIAFSLGDQHVVGYAATALAGLDPSAPLHEILAGLARAYATGDADPARRAQKLAEAEQAGTLAAEALTVRGQVGDEPAVTLAAAHTAWRQIGAPAKARAVAAMMRAAGLPAPVLHHRVSRVPAADRDALTARERALCRLVHEGRTNQQIARVLHISVKTVEAYLTRLYRKTSCSSRVELAVAVTERRIQVGD